MIKEMNLTALKQYLKVRDQIEELADRIHAISDLMSVFADFDESITFKSRTIGVLGRVMSHDVIMITSILDNDFISYNDLIEAIEANEANEAND